MPPEHENEPVEEEDNLGKLKPYRIFESEWKEVILLWLGREDIEYEEKDDFIEALLNFEDGCGDFYFYRAFFLAALSIAELQDHPKSPKIIQQIIKWSFGSADADSGKWFSYFDPIEKQARITLLSLEQSLILKKLIELLRLVENNSIRYEVADIISKIDFDNTEAIEALIYLLDVVENDVLKLRISSSLIQISADNSKAENILINLSKSGKYEWIRRDAAWNLIKAKSAHPVGIDALINLLCISKNKAILWNLNLDVISMNSPKTLRRLIKLSYLSNNREARVSSMNYLLSMLVLSEETIEKILHIVQIPRTILNLAMPLEQNQNHGVNCLKYIANLVDELQADESRERRRQAFWKLVKFTVHEFETSMLVAKLGIIEGGENRKRAVSKLFEKINIDLVNVVSIWTELINEIKDRRLRSILASKMGDAGFEDERIGATLVNLLENVDVQDEHSQQWLAKGLIKYDPTNSKSISTLFNLLQNSNNWDMCRWIASDLGEACNDNLLLIEPLLSLLSESHERRIRDGITSGLQEVFQADVVKTMVEKVKKFLSKEICESDFLLYKSSFEILWHCASKLSYAEFYEMWHEQRAESNSE